MRPTEDKASLGEEESYERFNPTFTYPVSLLIICDSLTYHRVLQIYGEEEKIYGYEGLTIDVSHSVHICDLTITDSVISCDLPPVPWFLIFL